MTPQTLAAAAKLLYGAQWQRALSRSLHIDDRLVRRWAVGDRPIPDWIRGAMIDALQGRLTEIKAEIENLTADEK